MRKIFTPILGGMLLGVVAVSCAGGSGAEESSEDISANSDYGYAGDEGGEEADYIDMDFESPEKYQPGSEKIAVSAQADSTMIEHEPKASPIATKKQMDRMLIKTATLSYEVEDLQATTHKVEAAMDQFNAYVGSMNQSDSYGRRTVSYQIKVPNENFEGLVRIICSGVNEFETKQIDVADVTEEFIDVKARIKTKKDLEDQYASLLDRAQTIPEILEIESHLSAVRAEIESAEGRIKYLSSNVKYSTIYLDYYEVIPELEEESQYSAAFGSSFDDGWHSFVMLFVGLTRLWPFLAIGSFVLAYFMVRRRKRKRALAA